ncbi:hypothetical protein ABT124_35075 [Streptomyces sp. NPDC001982]|uniref:hypothetical protein n=1 Tax=Streptomyces sp. NPDC001982 TaxID=3154405 RepID=UPI003321F39E
MMSRRVPEKHTDPAAASVSLAAEAALLEARLHILQQEIGMLDARIATVSDALRLLHGAPAASAQAADSGDHRGAPDRQHAS